MKKYDCRTREGKAFLDGSASQIRRIADLATRAEKAEAEVERLRAENEMMLREYGPELQRLRALVCDHHGGCQAHGYLSLKPGERCPMGEANEIAAGRGEDKP